MKAELHSQLFDITVSCGMVAVSGGAGGESTCSIIDGISRSKARIASASGEATQDEKPEPVL
jgi:hypothetical protein